MASLEEENRRLEKTVLPTRRGLRRSKEGVNEDCSYRHDVDLSHSGRKIARKPGEGKSGWLGRFSLTEFSKQPTIGTQLRLRRDRGTSDNPQIGKFNRLRFWILRDL